MVRIVFVNNKTLLVDCLLMLKRKLSVKREQFDGAALHIDEIFRENKQRQCALFFLTFSNRSQVKGV